MKLLLVLPVMLLISGCMNEPEPKSSEASMANTQIQENKTEAQLAQEEYLRLQKARGE